MLSNLLQMKLLLYSFIIILLSACSNEEQIFVCENEGLIITKDSATIAYLKYNFCGTQGTVNLYSTDCKRVVTSEIYFDTVAQSVRNSGSNKYVKCKRVN